MDDTVRDSDASATISVRRLTVALAVIAATLSVIGTATELYIEESGIDSQSIEIRGTKKRPGYTSLKRDLVQGQNGRWTVDKEKFYRHGE